MSNYDGSAIKMSSLNTTKINNIIPYVDVNQAISNFNNGELVAIPTETVYGLAANIHDEKATNNIYKLKGRPNNHPLIVHVHQNFDLEKYAQICSTAQKLIDKFWPAPLTLVLPKTDLVPEYVTGGQNTVAIRSPKHDLTQKLLAGLDYGIAAPSANRFGYISPTKAQHVYNEYLHHDMNNIKLSIVDGGDCEIGLESTIVHINSDNTISILRHGMLSLESLANVVEIKEIANNQDNKQKTTKNEQTMPRVSGDLPSHYAPKTKLEILTQKQIINLNYLNPNNFFIICFNETLHKINNLHNIKPEFTHLVDINPFNYAHDIYDTLRKVDEICQQNNINRIYIEQIPNSPDWLAIQDRLNRASHE
jgi:L-threonylcarbamoyladenylate synthase